MIVGAAVDRYADWGKEHVPAVDVFRAGMVGVVRYLSLNPAKNLTAVERDDLLAHGLDIRLVWETTETRSLEGTAAGVVDGVLAAGQAKALDYPAGHVIFASSDTDTTWAAVEPYHRAFKTAVEHYGYGWDVYGGYQVCLGGVLSGLSKAPWQTAAWSYGQVVPQAWAVQNDFHLPIAGVDCDGSTVLNPSTPWRVTAKPQPKPKPTPQPKPTPTGVEVTPQECADLLHTQAELIITHLRNGPGYNLSTMQAELAALKTELDDVKNGLASKGSI